MKLYVEDHIVPLEVRGHPSSEDNLAPQLKTDSKAKDRAENLVHKRICKGQITLAEGQKVFQQQLWKDYK